MSRELHKRLSDFRFSLDEMKEDFIKEQEESEANHDEWDADSEDEEPEVIDNSDSIGRYERAIGYLDKALKELDNE